MGLVTSGCVADVRWLLGSRVIGGGWWGDYRSHARKHWFARRFARGFGDECGGLRLLCHGASERDAACEFSHSQIASHASNAPIFVSVRWRRNGGCVFAGKKCAGDLPKQVVRDEAGGSSVWDKIFEWRDCVVEQGRRGIPG